MTKKKGLNVVWLVKALLRVVRTWKIPGRVACKLKTVTKYDLFLCHFVSLQNIYADN